MARAAGPRAGRAPRPARLDGVFLAVSYAFADSVNALLIGVIVAIGILLPRGKYRWVAPLLIFGDWLGVFLLALLVMFAFEGMQEFVQAALASPIFGIVLIAVGLVTAVTTWRSKPGGDSKIINSMLSFLREPTVWTVLAGFVLGVVQSLTSVPFYGGIAVLAAGDFSQWARYGGMFWYASVALSLSIAVAVFVGLVRRKPDSRLGRWFAWAREHTLEVSRAGGYLVAALLVMLGVLHL